MILDALPHAAAYHALSPHFKTAFAWLAATDLASLPFPPTGPARIPIQGDDIFAMPQEVLTRPPESCRWEAHRTYADIQLLIRGTERMAVAPIELFQEETPYNPEKDVAFYKALSGVPGTANKTTVTVPPGYFTLFLPHDVHMPLIQMDQPEKVFKVVVKVRV